jgi:hypothetical protein
MSATLTQTDDWFFGRRTVQARAEIDIEKTQESFHAYAVPTGIEIRPGDVVTVHDCPTQIAFGEHMITERPATISRAGSLLRTWTALTSMFLLTELYEVGFEPKETP